ncbi:MAG: transcription antitermination factor NusB [Acutalibacter sp.]|nr:transcription antitermination factor NusB [Acutalibacter sp.]
MTRREAREQAFCLLFEQACAGEQMENIIGAAAEARDLVLDPFAEELAYGVEEHLEKIDETINGSVKGWSIRRLSKVTLSLLRMAVYELLFENSTPASITINEAVLLAKKYGGQGDAPYLNGVLGTVARSLPQEKL